MRTYNDIPLEFDYNSMRDKLILPQYGRNIQRMVQHCVQIEDREERTKCAYSIIASMGNLFPQLRDEPDYKHKLWDHLAIMSDFKLDIDFPYDVKALNDLAEKPEKIEYDTTEMRYRHYGKLIERMIDRATEYEPSEERDALIFMIANHMKVLVSSINDEEVEDEKIFRDLYDYSQGKIEIYPEYMKLNEYHRTAQQQQTKQGKKKKKK
ncbi:MAG: DUF4290 domain-containing protein [Muribaculaceae bacterium]|nr:DUF4290 domain-containing protein [Muribaculaceae bacterium]